MILIQLYLPPNFSSLVHHSKNDIALGKAKVPGYSKARLYRFYQGSIVKPGTQVSFYCRWDNGLVCKEGQILPDSIKILYPETRLDDVLAKISLIPGDSGGVLATADFSIIGITCSVVSQRRVTFELHAGEKLIQGYAVIVNYKSLPGRSIHVNKILELVESYRNDCSTKL